MPPSRPGLRRPDDGWASPGELSILRGEALLHDGVLPIPFLGTTWARRGGAYWARRVGATALLALLTLVTGGLSAGFALGLRSGGAPAAVVALYASTALIGVWTGSRLARRAPIDDSRERPRMVFVGGLGALVLTPIAAGVCLAVLAGTLGRDFLGERRARELTAGWQAEKPARRRDRRP